MRISTSLQFGRIQKTIERGNDQLSLWQRRVSTGRRVEQPLDDPVGTVHALAIRQQLQQIDQYQRNIREAKLFLQSTEQAFSDIGEVLNQVRQIVTQGANDTLQPEAREALFQQVRKLQERLMQIGNQRVDSDRYLFSGQLVFTQPFTLVGTTLTYQGDGLPMQVPIANNHTLVMNFSGGRIADLYNKLNDIALNIQTANLADLSMNDLRDIEQFQAEFQRYRGEVGVRLREVETYTYLHQSRHDQLKGNLADIEEVDLAEAISQLRQSELSYQASLQIFTRVQSVNLFDFLRGG
ncbi:MAG: flagellar hook-associated protein FlgL [Fimbriimonadales bacterium]